MSEIIKDNATDGTPEGANDSTSGESSEGKQYSSDFVEKLKKEKENFRTQAQKRDEELENFKAEQKSREENALKEKEDFKQLYENKAKELEEAQGKLQATNLEKLDANKRSELKKELSKLGINPDYADKATRLADLGQIKIDKETGVMYGTDSVAKHLADEWPTLFGTTTESVSQRSPEMPSPTGALTLDEWKKLPYDERKKREGELLSGAR